MIPPAPALLDPQDYRRTPWKNGGGVTIDIAYAYRDGAAAGGWDGMLWRFGRTRIEQPGPFSDLSGYERLLAVIEGEGLVLHAQGRGELDVRQPFRPVRFGGDWPIQSALTKGPVGVLNLMADRARYQIDLTFPEPGTTHTLPPGQAVVLALGAAGITIGGTMHRLEQAWSCAWETAAPARLESRAGRIAVASIAPRR